MKDKKGGESRRQQSFERAELYAKLAKDIINDIVIKNSLTIIEAEEVLRLAEQYYRFIPLGKFPQIP